MYCFLAYMLPLRDLSSGCSIVCLYFSSSGNRTFEDESLVLFGLTDTFIKLSLNNISRDESG